MPIKKTTNGIKAEATKPLLSPTASTAKFKCCCGEFGKKIIVTLVGILLVYVIFYLGTLINNNIKKYSYIGKADRTTQTITVSGYGKVVGSNDIAITTIGYSNTDKDVSKAQAANKKVMDAVLADLKILGIDEKDLKSNYTIYPEYTYNSSNAREFSGYKVSNQVTVKVRNLSNIQNVLALAGKYGANQISSLNFTIDDDENLKSQARTKALADAKKKAAVIASSLGVRLVGVNNYSEYEAKAYADYSYGEGVGGGGSAPQVSAGSNTVEMNVSVTYEVK